MWAFRYSSEGKSRSLFYTTDIPTLRRLYPKRQILEDLSADAHLVVSEPIGDLPGAWNEVPEASCVAISAGREQILPFASVPPPRAAAPAG